MRRGRWLLVKGTAGLGNRIDVSVDELRRHSDSSFARVAALLHAAAAVDVQRALGSRR